MLCYGHEIIRYLLISPRNPLDVVLIRYKTSENYVQSHNHDECCEVSFQLSVLNASEMYKLG